VANLELELRTDVSAAQINRLFDEVRSNAEGAKKALNEALGGTVTKKIVFENIVDETGARKLVAVEKERLSVTDKVIAAQKQLERVQEGSVTSLRGQVRYAAQLRDGTAKYETSTRRISEAWAAANQQLSKLNRELAVASASTFWEKIRVGLNAQGLVNFSNGLIQITQGLQAASITIGQITSSVNKLVQASAGLQQFSLAFKAIGAGAAGAQQALAESSRISLNLGVSIKDVRNSFQQLSPVILNSGGSISDVSKVVESLSSRFAAFGISGDRARRVTNGIIQAFAKGKLMAEEFTQQIAEADPAFGTDFAKALKVSTQELLRMIQAGEVTTDVLLRGVIAVNKSATVYGKLGTSAKDAVESLAAGNVTIDQVQGKFESLSQFNLENFAKAFEPFTLAVLRTSAVVIDFIDRISKLESVKGLGSLFGGLANVINAAVETILNATEGLLRFADAVTALAGPLTKIPGLAEAFGVVILAKLVAPLAAFKQDLIKTAAEGRGFGAFLAKLSLGAAKPLDDIAKKSGQIGPTLSNSFQRASKAIGDFSSRGDKAKASLIELSKSNVELSTRIAAGEARLTKFKGLLNESSASLNRAKQSTSSFAAAGGSIGPLETKTNNLRNAVKALEGDLGRLKAQKGAVGAALEVNRQAVKDLGLIPTTLKGIQGASGLAVGAFNGIKNAIGGVVAAIGPLGFAMIAIAAATSSYNQINKEANAILDGSKQRVNALDESIKALGGSTEDAETPITGLALVWAQFGLAINSVTEKINKFFSASKNGASEAAELEGSSKNASKGFDLLAIGIGAAAGALAGARFGKFGVIIGGIAGALIAISATGSDAGVKLEELKKRVAAIGLSAQTESRKIIELVNALNKINEGGGTGGGGTVQIAAGYQQLKSALEGVTGLQQQLTSQQQIYQTQLAKLGPSVASAFPAFQKLKEAQKIANEEASKGIFGDPEKLGRAIAEIIKAVAELERLGVPKEAIESYGNLQNALKVVNDELVNVSAQVEAGTAAFNQFAEANGLSSAELLKTANNSVNLNKALSDLQGLLALIDPTEQAAKWAEINQTIAETQSKLDRLNGTAANITVNAIEAQGAVNTLAELQRYQQALSQQQTFLSINSSELDVSLEKTRKLQIVMEALSKTKAQLSAEIDVGRAEIELAALQRNAAARQQSFQAESQGISKVAAEIQKKAQAEDAAYQKQIENVRKLGEADQKRISEEIAGIQRAAAARDKSYQNRIAQLQKLGPAEQKLKDKEIADLKLQAARGETEEERLQAQAQLERLAREEKIAEVEKQRAAQREQDERRLQALEEERQEAAKKREAEIAAIEEERQARQLANAAKLEEAQKKTQGVQAATAASQEKSQGRIEELQEKINEKATREKEERLSILAAVLEAKEGGDDIAKALGLSAEEAAELTGSTTETAQKSSDAASSIGEMDSNMKSTAVYADSTKRSLELADTAVKNIVNNLNSLDGKTITVTIKGGAARYAGGPVQGGSTYTVNELGREGFLSSGGRLTTIDRPAYASWRAPGSGTVIPAHIMSGLDVPTTGVRVKQHRMPSVAPGGSFKGLAKAIQGSLSNRGSVGPSGLQELASVQAQQAIQIGKLSRAVSDLTEKNWNVQVNVKNSGQVAYLEALNRSIR
jgi:tape measure domain-containing protein